MICKKRLILAYSLLQCIYHFKRPKSFIYEMINEMDVISNRIVKMKLKLKTNKANGLLFFILIFLFVSASHVFSHNCKPGCTCPTAMLSCDWNTIVAQSSGMNTTVIDVFHRTPVERNQNDNGNDWILIKLNNLQQNLLMIHHSHKLLRLYDHADHFHNHINKHYSQFSRVVQIRRDRIKLSTVQNRL